MDFRLTDEQRLVRDNARDFVDRELIPHVREWEEKGEIPKAFYRQMAGLGFLGAPVPEKYGVAGMDYVSFMLLVEEISRGSSSVRTTVSVQTSLSETSLMWFGSEAQKEAWLVPLAKGERLGAWAITEPEAGRAAGDVPPPARLDRHQRGLDRHRGRRGRRGPGRPRSRVKIRERSQGIRAADRRLPVDPGDDRAVGGRDRRRPPPHPSCGALAGSGTRQHHRGLDGQAVRSPDGPTGHGLGRPGARGIRVQRRLRRGAGFPPCTRAASSAKRSAFTSRTGRQPDRRCSTCTSI